MEYLFLDVDGVCNAPSWWSSAERARIRRAAPDIVTRYDADIREEQTRRIRRVVRNTGCTVILHSAWCARDFSVIAAIFRRHGINIADATRRDVQNPIFDGLTDYVARELAEDDRWIVVNDDITDAWAICHGGRAVTPKAGMTEADALLAISFLRGA